jgi:hypothetical protein
MKRYIVDVKYRVEFDDDILTEKEMEEIEAQRWQMFQKKFGVQPLNVFVKELK